MAGDFVKWRRGFAQSAAVMQIARFTGLDMRVAAACLMEFYEWFDAHANNYEVRAKESTPESIDKMLRFPDGFTDAVVKARVIKKLKHRFVAVDRSWFAAGSQTHPGRSFVYFIRSLRTNLVKIGFSTNPKKRLQWFNTSEPVSLLGMVPGTQKSERKFHERFASSREHGEWFRLSDDLAAFLRDRGFIE